MRKQAGPVKNILLSPFAPIRTILAVMKRPLDVIADPTGKGRSISELVKSPEFYAVNALGLGADYGLYKGYKNVTTDPAERRLETLGEVMAPISDILGLNDMDRKHSGLATAALLASPVAGAIISGEKGFGQGAGAAAGSLAGYHAGKHLGNLIAEGNIITGLNKDQKDMAKLLTTAGVTALGGLGGINLANKLREEN